MKEYYLLDKKDAKPYTLAPVTARVEKGLADLGLGSADFGKTQELVTKWLEEQGDELVKLCNVIFRGETVKKEDLIDIDKTVVKEAMLDFFLADLMLMSKYGDSSLISSLVSLNQMKTEPQS